MLEINCIYHMGALEGIKDEQAQTRIVFPETLKPEQTKMFKETP